MKKIVFIISLIIFLNSCELDDITSPSFRQQALSYTDFMINNPGSTEYVYDFKLYDYIYPDYQWYSLSAEVFFNGSGGSKINCGNILLGNILLEINENNSYFLPELFATDIHGKYRDSLMGRYFSLHIPENSTYDLPEVTEEVYIVKSFKFTEKNPDTFSINEDFTIQWETDSIASDVIVVIDNYQSADLGDEIYDSESVSDTGEYTISQELLKKYSSTDRINITLIREKATHDNISGFTFRFLSYSIESKLFYLKK